MTADALPPSPSADPSSASEAFVVAVDHRTAPAALRERLFLSDDALPAFLSDLRADGLIQAVALSTCDRTAVFGMHGDPGEAAARAAHRLASLGNFTATELAGHLAVRQGEAALEYLFAVAASLESTVVGEPQVLGQLRDAYRAAVEAGAVGAELDRAMQAAFACAKRVRTDTGVGARAVSIAAAALQVAREVHGDLTHCVALFVGAGEMGELFAEKLREAGVIRFLVADSLAARAQATAHRMNANIFALDALETAMAEADIVVSALGRGVVAIGPEIVRAALRRRRQRPIFLVDAAVPGDVSPQVDAVDEVFLYGLDDLENVALQGRAARDQEAEKAWEIVRAAVAEHQRYAASREAVPAVAALRAHFEAMRARLLAEQPSLSAEEATRLLINRLLHAPSEGLRGLAAEGRPAQAQQDLLVRLFGLDPTASDGGRSEES